MKNCSQNGVNLDLVAPYDVNSGDMFKVGGIIAVAAYTASEDEVVVGVTEGVFTDIPLNSGDSGSQGDVLYWNDTDKELTTTASGNTKAGHATEDFNDAPVSIRLNF